MRPPTSASPRQRHSGEDVGILRQRHRNAAITSALANDPASENAKT